jgi:hypothetical protein
MFYSVSPPASLDAKAAKLNIISFAVERTAKENTSSFIKEISYQNTIT